MTDGVVKLHRLWVVCPACGRKVEAVATDGRVKGYCAVRGQYVNFPVEIKMPPSFAGKHHTAESRAKMSATRTGKHHTAGTKAKISNTIKSLTNKGG